MAANPFDSSHRLPDSSSPAPPPTASSQHSPHASSSSSSRSSFGKHTPLAFNAASAAPPTTAKRRFKSCRLREEYPKPWLEDKAMRKTRWNNVIIGIWVVIGVLAAAVVAFFMSRPFLQKEYCLIYEDNFDTLDTSVWSHEVQLDGFGNHAFDWTTTDPLNAYVDAAGLHIVPTLTTETTNITEAQLYANHTLTLDADGSCTGARNTSACVMRSDPKRGAFLPPVRSARLTTRGRKSIRYGQIEVRARLPRGDWLWPAIWMMPEDDAYGAWPRSGEMDIMESRGNDAAYADGGRNVYESTLHWGPTARSDAYRLTTGGKKLRRGGYADGVHTFGMQWTPDYVYFYVDGRVHQILFVGFRKGRGMYELGGFARQTPENGSLVLGADPWAGSTSETGNAPFDQKFYLVLNVAVGGTNGFFADNVGEKPWVNGATNARFTFWDAKDKWLPTWGEGDERGMTVRSVKMWQLGACGGEL